MMLLARRWLWRLLLAAADGCWLLAVAGCCWLLLCCCWLLLVLLLLAAEVWGATLPPSPLTRSACRVSGEMQPTVGRRLRFGRWAR